MDTKIKTSYVLSGEAIDRLDRRSEESMRLKSEQLESDLTTLWRILDSGYHEARTALTREEVRAVFTLLKKSGMRGGDIVMWARVGMVDYMQSKSPFIPNEDLKGVDCERLIDKIIKLPLSARVAICDWVVRTGDSDGVKRFFEEG